MSKTRLACGDVAGSGVAGSGVAGSGVVGSGVAVFIVAAVALASGCSGESVQVERGSEVVATFCIDVASTAAERAMGLRGSEPLCSDCGLLIEFPRSTEVCIVNQGVSFDLDVMFFDELGELVALERDVKADDATSRCHPDILSVLEVSASAAADISLGDTLVR